MKGKIKKFLSYRGYGFIELLDSEDDIFFHISNYPRTTLPKAGQDVEFELIETPKGKEAKNITVTEKTGEIFTAEAAEAPAVQPEEKQEEIDDLDTLNGVGPTYRKLLRAAGVSSKIKLIAEKPETLYEKLNKANEEHGITKRPPTLANVEAWINLAR